MDASKLDNLPKTPMWEQYSSIKRHALDALLFYRMGDFYELFLDDAEDAAKILGITLTARHKDIENPVPMCGVPFHSASTYIQRLLASGKRIAICEQTSEPSAGKGIVKREIVRVVSPGVTYDNDSLSNRENNFLLAINAESANSGTFAGLDVSTGKSFFGSFHSLEELLAELSLARPSEVLIAASAKELAGETWWQNLGLSFKPLETRVPDHYFSLNNAYADLCRSFRVHSLDAFGLSANHKALAPLKALLKRVQENERLGRLSHLRAPEEHSASGHLLLDAATIEHLDLLPKKDRSEREALLWHVDRTRTAVGARKLRSWIERPLTDIQRIEYRLDAVAAAIASSSWRESLRAGLTGIRDLERIYSKIGLGTAGPRDLLGLKESLLAIQAVRDVLAAKQTPFYQNVLEQLAIPPELYELIDRQLKEDAASHLREGGVFKAGWHEELTELIRLSSEGVQLIAEMENREREETAIPTLKIRYHRTFGYYIEITKNYLDRAPAHYTRKQTTVGGERFITEELKDFEQKVISAGDRRIRLEQQLFRELLESVEKFTDIALTAANGIGELDAILSMATVAFEHNWSRPTLNATTQLNIIGGRHPVVEALVGPEKFVRNDTNCSEQERLLLITGPNMAGKSTFMRQTALIVVLAQMGGFVPAKKCELGIVDRIASRVGASDRIGQGQSTFMVEMSEMARILHSATNRSLVIVDEIGRGTSTFDGLALAWAILEHLEAKSFCRTLFATHYHELTALETQSSAIRNFNVAVARGGPEGIQFLHRVERGTADGSYGIEVAKLAGMPNSVLARARSILARLERGGSRQEAQRKKMMLQPELALLEQDDSPMSAEYSSSLQESAARRQEHELLAEIAHINLNQCTPMEALLKIQDLQKRLPRELN